MTSKRTEIIEDGNSSDFDTDLENEEKANKEKKLAVEKESVRENMGVGQLTYKEVCKSLGTVPIRKIIDQLPAHEMRLQHVGMNNNHCKALSCALWHNTSLESLDLEDNGLTSEDLVPVINVFKNNIYISSLSLAENVIDVVGAMALDDVLKESEFLTQLNLSGTRLGDKEMEYIASGIQHNSSLRWLNLSHNEISVAGAKTLGRAIRDTTCIQFLNLGWNHIRMEGGVAICKGLQANNSIINLDINMNGLGFEGSLALEETLRENTCLKYLDISNNRINWEGVSYVAKGIRKNGTLQMLNIGSNPINMEGCYELVKAATGRKNRLIHIGLDSIPVNGAVLRVADEIQKSRPFSINHGGVLDTRDIVGIVKVKPEDPISLVVRYLSVVGIRIIDLFRMFDTSNDGQVSKDKFIRGLKRVGVPLGDRDLNNVANRLDKRKKGWITYSNLANGVRNHIREERKEDKRLEVKKRNRLEERRRVLQTSLPHILKRSYDDDKFLFTSISTENLTSRSSNVSVQSLRSATDDKSIIFPQITNGKDKDVDEYDDIAQLPGTSTFTRKYSNNANAQHVKPYKMLRYINAYLDRRKSQANFDTSTLPS